MCFGHTFKAKSKANQDSGKEKKKCIIVWESLGEMYFFCRSDTFQLFILSLTLFLSPGSDTSISPIFSALGGKALSNATIDFVECDKS